MRGYRVVRRMVPFVTVLGIVLFAGVSVQAARVDSAISQGFTSKDALTVGTLVSFKYDSKTGAVEAANSDNGDRLLGVISQQSLVELTDGERNVQVAIGGTTLALVSDINGDIKQGDKITVSPISGVGMKATKTTQIVGAAQEGFSSASQVNEREVTDKSGKKKTVKIGLIPVQVNVSYYQKPNDELSFLPSFLQQLANNIAGRTVSQIRVLIAVAIIIAGSAGVGILLYASVRSSIISIGRNPLSADAVNKSLFEVGGLAVGILLATLIGVYLVLII